MAEARLNIRIDADVKSRAEDVFQKLGLTMSSGVNVFLSKVAAEQCIPFSLTLDRVNTIGYDAFRFEQAAVNVVREEMAEYGRKGKPVARYDEIRKLPFLEYPDGRKDYNIGED
jgi:DNA-damage-inducible protein J